MPKNRNGLLAEIGSLIEAPVFYEHLSARKNPELHLAYMNVSGTNIEKAPEMAGLSGVGAKEVSKFSLDLRQRLGIARAFIHQPRVLILDEPINGLAPMGIREMRELFVSLSRNSNMTILISSHIVSEIEHVADKIGAISILLFGILSAAMYSHLIIEEYSGKRLALLFSYPGSRKRIFMTKVLVVFLFVLVSMLLCTLIPVSIFAATESFSPIVSDKMTSSLITSAFKMTFLSILAVSAIGLLSLRIGFRKKSIAATLVSSFILSCHYGNLSVTPAGNPSLFLLIAGFSAGITFMVLFSLINKIEHMEVL